MERGRVQHLTGWEFEKVVDVLGNPIRRRIIQKLSEGPDYTLRISKELNIHQQLASKHLKVIRNAELVDVVRQPSRRGADKNVFSLKKFYSLQIDFSPNLYNQRLISFNNPQLWINADQYMDKLEDEINSFREESGVETVTPLAQIIQSIDDELEHLEKRRARLLYLRDLAMRASSEALEELDRKKRQLVQYVLNQGSTDITSISRHMQLREEVIRDLVRDLVREDLLYMRGNEVTLPEFAQGF